MNWYRKALSDKVYEPQKRNKDGLRYIGHRFPIKGGISLREVMLRTNVFLSESADGDYKIGDKLRVRLPVVAT